MPDQNVATIASVHWAALKAVRPYRAADENGHMTEFRIEGVRPGDPPATVRVQPCYAIEHIGGGRYTETLVLADEVRAKSAHPMRDSAKEVAKDIVNQWTQQTIGMEGLGPGIWVCKLPFAPTKAEIEAMWEKQMAWSRFVVLKAEELWLKGERNAVAQTDFYRNAARHLGEENYEWCRNTSPMVGKMCPFCGRNTPAGVPICQHCDRVHDPALMKQVEEKLPQVQERLRKIEDAAPKVDPPTEGQDEQGEPELVGTGSQAYQRKLERFKEKARK